MSSIESALAFGYLDMPFRNVSLKAPYAVGGSRVMTVPESMMVPPAENVEEEMGSLVPPTVIPSTSRP